MTRQFGTRALRVSHVHGILGGHCDGCIESGGLRVFAPRSATRGRAEQSGPHRRRPGRRGTLRRTRRATSRAHACASFDTHARTHAPSLARPHGRARVVHCGGLHSAAVGDWMHSRMFFGTNSRIWISGVGWRACLRTLRCCGRSFSRGYANPVRSRHCKQRPPAQLRSYR